MLTISAKIETILIPEKILVRNKLMKKLIVSQKNQEWQMVYTREKIKNQKINKFLSINPNKSMHKNLSSILI